jgi:hypothetical protein
LRRGRGVLVVRCGPVPDNNGRVGIGKLHRLCNGNEITIPYVRDEQRPEKNNQRFHYVQHGRFTIE